jgi:hypothetical protein
MKSSLIRSTSKFAALIYRAVASNLQLEIGIASAFGGVA